MSGKDFIKKLKKDDWIKEGGLQMRTTIPCKITYSEADTCWYVEAPGFYDGIMTYGDTLEEAKKMAGEAVAPRSP